VATSMQNMSSSRPQFRKPDEANKNDANKKGDEEAEKPSGPNWRWFIIGSFILLGVFFFVPDAIEDSRYEDLAYNQLLDRVRDGEGPERIVEATIDNDSGTITAEQEGGQLLRANGPAELPDADRELFSENNVTVTYQPAGQTSALSLILPFLLPVVILVGLFLLLRRQASGQMNGMMNIGRSKAKVYSSERPDTTFDDIAGYKAAKTEINEVVDFLKNPKKFEDVGARIPKGVLLVGPPGTGKTLLARAVAGEAGVPFMSVTGSDFMEMFVGVGASRVRDLFQTARKQAPAIVFIDEIDSIGRKRGAGLGGGHDEREQTLNQMLSEMDGFEAAEGVVMMAATNRPDILDPALLRPGRFDRQVVVPLPDMEERLPIIKLHCRDRKVNDDVNMELVAKGTPGMSGADLANLVNEAALQAVRRGSDEIHMIDFEAARDRIIMGQRRESLALTDEEKERVAFHEGGHAVLAYVLPNADPLHKVTILPTGMALGVTQQLPMEERHIYSRDYIEDSLAVRMGGRVAELLIYGDLSTGASNDLLGNTDLARKMVREWGMSDKIGPAAWGSQGQVFLGEDLLHSGEQYSDGTSEIIDQEVQRILRESEHRADVELRKHLDGLRTVAKTLLEHETIDGAEVARIINEAHGGPVHHESDTRVHFTSPLSGSKIKTETSENPAL
jgi:cell division protease FtsH